MESKRCSHLPPSAQLPSPDRRPAAGRLRRAAGLVAALVLLGASSAAQMTVRTTASGTGRDIRNDNNESSYPRYYDYDINNTLQSTPGYSGEVWYQALSAIDTQWLNGTTATGTEHSYRYYVDIEAPNRCWELHVTSTRKGRVGAWDDNDRGHAHAAISSITASTTHPTSLWSGTLAVPGLHSENNENDEDQHRYSNPPFEDGPAVAHFRGFGSQTVELRYSWDTSLTSTVAFLGGGDEAIVEMGVNMASGGSAFQNGREDHTDFGHRVHLELTTVEPPSLVGMCPSYAHACAGQTTSLSVSASGDDLFYAWTKDGLPYDAGPGLSELVFDPITAGDEGNYQVTISNSCGSVQSCPIFLEVDVPAGIQELLVSPAQPMCAGEDLTITVVATGTGPFTYAWQFQPQGSTQWQPKGSSSFYSDGDILATASGAYRVTVTNECGSIESAPVTVTVHSPPVVTRAAGTPHEMCAGEDLVLVALVTGTDPDLQWYFKGNSEADFELLDGATDATYQITDASALTSGVYRIDAVNECGADSEFFPMQVTLAPTLSGELDQDVCLGDVAILSAHTGSGDPPLSYYDIQWFKDDVPVPGSRGQEEHLNVHATSEAEGGIYRLEITDRDGCFTTSIEGTVTVLAPPAVTLDATPDPAFMAACGAVEGLLVANVTQAEPPLRYRWFKNGALDSTAPDGPVLEIGTVQEPTTYQVEVTSLTTGCRGLSNSLVLASAQDGEHARWSGPDGGHLLTYGLWQRLLPISQACGSWSGSLDTFGVCPPLGFGRFENSGGTPNRAILGSGERWSMQQLEIQGSAAAEQRLSLETDSLLEVEVCTTLKTGGVLSLEGGELDAGLFTVKSAALVEGHGALVARGVFDNFGRIRSGGTSAQLLTLLTSGPDPLYNHPGALLELPSGSASVRLGGSLQNGTLGVPSGRVELESRTMLDVSGTITNHGLVQVAHSGSLPQSEVLFRGFDNVGGLAWLKGGRMSVTGSGLFENHPSAPGVPAGKLHGYGALLSDAVNHGEVWVRGPAGSILTVLGCFDNEPDGQVKIDAGTTLVLHNGDLCAVNQGTISFTGPGSCVGCASAVETSAAALTVVGDFGNGPGAQLLLREGLLQVDGDFRSEIAEPYAFDLATTRVELNGAGAGGAQALALAAPDLGVLGDFGSRAAQAVGELVVAASSSVTLAPRADGTPTTLYVEHLQLAAGAHLDLGTGKVYAEQLTLDPGATLALSGGQLYYGATNLADPCSSGQVLGSDCAARFAPMPAPDCDADGVADELEIAAGTEPDCNANGVPDACDVLLGRSLDQDHDSVPDDCQWLHADRPWVSASQGGTQTLELHAGVRHAGRAFVLSTWIGKRALLPASLRDRSMPGELGLLDGEGRATRTIEIVPGQLDLIGLDIHHRFTLLEAGRPLATSNLAALRIRP